VLKGYRAHLAKTKDPKAKPRKAPAITPDDIRAMFARFGRDTAGGCRDVLLLLLSFAVAARCSELVALNIGDVELVAGKGMLVTMYRGKVRKLQVVPVKYASGPGLCPVRAFEAWTARLAACGRAGQGAPLFVRVDRHGNIGPEMTRDGKPIGDPAGRITPQAVNDVVGRKALAAALPGRTSHGLRRGFVTAAYEAGADRVEIADAGGWERDSRVMLGYIQESETWEKHPLDGVL
jgi:integrase